MRDENPSDSTDRGPAPNQTLDGQTLDGSLAATAPGLAPGMVTDTVQVSVNLNLADALQHWDRYEILSLLGEGGMGVVYRARDRRLGRIVALKFIRAVSPQTAQRFVQEARAQARIAHENVCKVFEVGEVGGQKYIAMEYLAGEPLHAAQRRLAMTQKLQLIKDLAEALHAAHVLGIIHRDLKPANVMVVPRPDKSDRPVLMDFGLARDASATEHLTETGVVMGTPAYMAPEQAQGDHSRIDLRSDVYGLGAVMYELLCGQTPFAGHSTVQVLITVMNDDPVPLRRKSPAVPVDVETIVMKCLSKEPLRRYDSALALADDIGRFLAGEPIAARQTTWSYRVRKKARKHRTLVALSGLLWLSLIALLAVGIRARWQAADQRRRAAVQAQLAQRLGQDVKEMELFMRAAYALPLHDIGRERKVVRRRLAQIEQQLQTLEPSTRGPAYYALGRGYLVLHEPAAARPQLEQALHAGYSTPEVHEALGQTLAAIYDQVLHEITHSRDYLALDQRKRRLQTELMQPALQHLERAVGVQGESPALQRALLSWLRRDLQAVLTDARQAESEVPWRVEPLLLQAKAEEVLRRSAAGQAPSDAAGRDHIAELYARITDIARSDPESYYAEAWFWSLQMHEELVNSQDLRPSLDHLKVACEHGATADPSRSYFPIMLAGGYSYLARWQQQSGLDPQASAQQGLRIVEAALRSAATDDLLHIIANNLHLNIATFRAEHALDPRPELELAIASAKRGLGVFPGSVILHNDLFATYLQRGEYLMYHGGDPEPSLRAAWQELELLAQIPSDQKLAAMDRAAYYQTAAEAARIRGQDAAPFIAKLLPMAREQVRLQPHGAEALNLLTSALLAQVPRRLAAGEPTPALLDEAALLIERSMREFAQSPDGFVSRAQLAGWRAEALLQAGSSPLGELAQGLAALHRAGQIKPGRVDIRVQQGRLCLLQAKWLQTQRLPLQDALRCIEQAVTGADSGPHAELLILKSRALRLQALLPATQPAAVLALLNRARQTMVAARTLTPQYPLVDAEEGAVCLLLAQRERPAARGPLTTQALTLLTRALQRDGTAAKEYGPLLRRIQPATGG